MFTQAYGRLGLYSTRHRMAESAAAPVLKKHRYRDVKIADGMTVTIDLEEVAEKIKQDFYRSQLGRFC